MKRPAAFAVALAAAAAVTPARAAQPYEIDWTEDCYLGSFAPQAKLSCSIAEGAAFFHINDLPIPTRTIYAMVPQPNGDQKGEFAASFDSVLLHAGANTFAAGIFAVSGDDTGNYTDSHIDLVAPGSRLPLWFVQMRGQPFVGIRNMTLSLAQIDPALSMSLQKLESAVDTAFDALIRDAASIQNLDLKLDQLQSLQDDVDALVDAGIENITQDALDGVLAKYSALDPSLLDPLRDVVKVLQMDVGALRAEVQRIEGDFQQQLSDLDQQLGVQSTPGVDLHAPGTYTPGVGASTVPPIDIPPLTGPDDWDPLHDPFAAVADDTIGRLKATLSDGKVADRAGFYDAYTEWSDNQKALSQWITTRAPYRRKEYAAYVAAQQRVEVFVKPFVDAQGWLADAPVPQDVKNLVDVLKRLKMEMQARNVKRALNQWDPAQSNDSRELVLDTMRAAVGGFILLEDGDIDPSAFPNLFKMFTDLMDNVVVAVKDAAYTVVMLTPVANVIGLCEAVTGWRRCQRGGEPMSFGDQVWSGIGVLAGTDTFWHYAGAVVKVPARKVSGVIERLVAKLADRKRLKALLVLVEKDANKLGDLLQLFKPEELEQVAGAVGEKEFTVVMRDLEAAELRAYVDKVGQSKLAELAKKFDGSVLKHYSADFFAAFKGITNETKKHLLIGEGIAQGEIKGLHDKAKFFDLLVTQGNGEIITTTVNGGNSKLVKYEYKLYRRSPTGSVALPPTLASGDPNIKTVIQDLDKDWDKWQKAAEEAIEDSMRKKDFPTSGAGKSPRWSGASSDGTQFEGYFRDNEIATFYPYVS